MKLDKNRLDVAMAENCMLSSDVQKKSGLPKGTYLNAITGKNVRPATLGKIAKAVNVPVTEIIK